MDLLVQIDAYDPVAPGAVTLYASSVDDDRVCHLNSQTWFPAIARAPVLRYDFFDGSFGRQIEAPSSGIQLSVEPWPNFARYAFADARIQIWTGSAGDVWGSWVLRFDGRVTAQPKISNGITELVFAVDDRWLDDPLLPTYAGTTGAEGASDQKGQAKPLALGAPRFVPGMLIDQTNNVVQLSSVGLIEDVEVAFDSLVRFSAPTADYATYAALVAASIPAGRWATAKAVGMVRHGAPFAGRPSYHVKGDKAGPDGWARKPGQLIRRLALLSGGTGRISDASLNALDTARPWNVSLYVDQQTTARDLIQRLAASVNAVAGVSWLGQLFVLPIGIGTSSMTLAADGSALPPVASVDQIEMGVPWWKLAIESERTWAVHGLSEIAFTADLIDCGAYDDARAYREGNIVFQPVDGNRYLYINATPTIGFDPPNVTYWALYQAADPLLNALFEGTLNYRTSGAPDRLPYPVSLPVPSQNANGSVNYTLTWDHYVQGAKPADMLIIFYRKDGSAPTYRDSAIVVNVNTTWRASYVMNGVNPADMFSFGIAAARRTEAGLEIGPIQTFTGSESRTNLILQSETFDNASWAKNGLAGTPVIANALAGPDGATTADTIVSGTTGGSNTAYIDQVRSVSPGNIYALTIYVKPGTSPRSLLNFYRVSPYAEATLNITWGPSPTFVMGGTIGLGYCADPVADGFYRVGLLINAASAGSLNNRLYVRGNGTDNVSGETVHAFGAQLEDVNLLNNYNDFSSASWPKTNCTVTANNQVAPDGTTTADTITRTATGNHYIRQVLTTKLQGKHLRYSVWLKLGTLTGNVSLRIENSGVQYYGVATVSPTATWAEYIVEAQIPDGVADKFDIYIDPSNDAGSAGDTLFVWAANLVDLDGFAKPYAPTTTAAVTTAGPDMLAITVGTPNHTGQVNGRAASDISMTVASGGGVDSNQVSTDSIVANGVTIPVSSYTASGTSQTPGGAVEYQVQSQAITSTGGPLQIHMAGQFDVTGGGGTVIGNWRLKRGGTVIYTSVFYSAAAAGNGSAFSFPFVETPGAGTFTYTLHFNVTSILGSPTWNPKNCSLVITELKR